jgi:steroid 5-alpha reductase family enzyme
VNGLSLTPFLVNLAVSAAVIAILMALIMALSARLRDWSIIDIFWGPGFVVVAVTSYLVSMGHGDDARRLIALLVPAVWGLRLGTYIFLRNRGHGQDPRYTAMLRHATGSVYAFVIRKVYWPQGWAMWLVSLPIQLAMFEHAAPNWITWVGVALAAIGIGFESIGDAQLMGFKKDPANDGRIMDRGLWRYTRHPNYFGDVCVMFGLWLVSLGHWLGLVLVIAPAYMTHLLLNVSGKALLERRMTRKRGAAYEAYVARTSPFFPWPPKRIATVPAGPAQSPAKSEPPGPAT